MIELTPETAEDYLIATGRIAPGDSARVRLLTGGVSNMVLLIVPSAGEPLVLKQSRTQLRTQADWFSRLDRVFREVEAQRALSELLPSGAVPRVLFEDRENYCYAMTAVSENHRVWKQSLLAGEVEQELFAIAGRLLANIHIGSLGKPEFLAAPEDVSIFYELRVDPYYRWIAGRHSRIGPAIESLIAEMQAHAMCLVHADFSPKNLLIHNGRFSLVDYETVHYGDPAFDLGFFFSHLWLKAVALPSARERIVNGIQAGWGAYRDTWSSVAAKTPGTVPRLSSRAVRHLAGCLLSRIDGKSSVDYLTNPQHQAFVRELSLDWLASPPEDLDVAFAELSHALADVRNLGD